MSHGHADIDKVLEHAKSLLLVLTIIDCTAGVLLMVFPVFIGNLFLYSVEALPVQMLGGACLAVGVVSFLVRHCNRSAYRIILDQKIFIGIFTLVAVLFDLFFADVKWTLILLVIGIIAITGVAVHIRRMIPREDAHVDHSTAH